MADTYLNKKGAQHRAEKTKEWADARFVRYTTYNAVGVAGSGKNVSVLFPQTLYVPDGLIMGGTALSAGLATRGICGVTTPDGKGGCTKENLYLNYDGNNNYSRKVVLGAGSAGNEIANSSGAYTFSAVRGDQMVSYVTNYVPGAIKTWFDSNVHIPSVGNGTITIQKNGTNVGSFTTNQSGNKTIDLTLGVSDVSGLKSTLDGKMDTYTITKEPSSMGKNGFAQFGIDVTYQLTQYYQLSRAFGYVRAVEKGGQVSNNNSYFTGFGEVGGGTYIGTAVYDRDYNSTTGALYTSHGLLIDAYGSAFLLSGSKNSETIKQIATTDDTKSLQNSIDGKQAKLVSGTNIKTINGTSILGGGDIPVVASLAEKSLADIINATSSKSGYAVIDKLLIQWGVYNGAHGDTTNWEVTYPKTFYWYPAVILQTKDTNTGSQGIPYSNGAVITSYRGGESFTFQLRRSETCPVYWIAIGGLR